MNDDVLLHRDALNLGDAAQRIGWTEYRLLDAVVDGVLRVGVRGRAWMARAHPLDDKWPRFGWQGHHVDDVPNQDFQVYKNIHPSGVNYTAQEFRIIHFWYLHHSNAYHLIVECPDGVPVKWLEPVHGARWQSMYPETTPSPDFIAWVWESRNKDKNLVIKKDDLLFLKKDLDRVKATPIEKPLSTKERETLLKMVYHMARDGYGWDPAAKTSPFTKELAELIDMHPDTVREYLKQAKRTVTFEE